MHDPMILAFRIRLFGRNIANIWHVDPETDGSDDSCGWSRPKMTKEQSEKIKARAKSEYEFWLEKRNRRSMLGGQPMAVYEIIYWVWCCVAYELDKRAILYSKKGLSAGELNEIMQLSSNPHDSIRSVAIEGTTEFGYETERLFSIVARAYLRYHRKWWQHPRWHLHHWKININLISKCKRWLFKRCDVCGKRLGWNETAMGDWGGVKIWHQLCHHEKYDRKVKEEIKAKEAHISILGECEGERSCTCNPLEAPVPCMKKYSYQECLQAWKDGVASGEIKAGFLPKRLSNEELDALFSKGEES